MQSLMWIDPNDGKMWNLRADTLNKMGRNEEAGQSYDNAIKQIQCPDGWNNKGRLKDELGKYKEAIDCYDKALQINPKIGRIWFNKGESIQKMKKGGFGKFFKFGRMNQKSVLTRQGI